MGNFIALALKGMGVSQQMATPETKAQELADEIRTVGGTDEVTVLGDADSATVSCWVVEPKADAVRELADNAGFTPGPTYTTDDDAERFLSFDYEGEN